MVILLYFEIGANKNYTSENNAFYGFIYFFRLIHKFEWLPICVIFLLILPTYTKPI